MAVSCGIAAPSGRRVLRRHWYRSVPAAKVTGRRRTFCPRGFPGQFSARPGSVEVNGDEAPPHTHQGARMSSHKVSGAIAYQEGQRSNQVRRWRAFAVLAVSFFMTVADL